MSRRVPERGNRDDTSRIGSLHGAHARGRAQGPHAEQGERSAGGDCAAATGSGRTGWSSDGGHLAHQNWKPPRRGALLAAEVTRSVLPQRFFPARRGGACLGQMQDTPPARACQTPRRALVRLATRGPGRARPHPHIGRRAEYGAADPAGRGRHAQRPERGLAPASCIGLARSPTALGPGEAINRGLPVRAGARAPRGVGVATEIGQVHRPVVAPDAAADRDTVGRAIPARA